MLIKDWKNHILVDFDITKIEKELPNGIYKLNVGKQIIFEEVDFDELPEIIGKEHKRIFNKILDREASSLLLGKSGFGKTLIVKHLAKKLSEKYPVIIIDRVNINVLKAVSQFLKKAVFIFDEFEKNFLYLEDLKEYENEDYNFSQEALLSFFDGMSKKHIFLLTANDKEKISPYIFNRPGRIRYVFEFEKLEDDILEEFGFNEEDVKKLKIINTHIPLSFDILKFLKEESEYGYSVEESLKDLGINVDFIVKLLDYKKGKIIYNKGKNEKQLALEDYYFQDNGKTIRAFYLDKDGDLDYLDVDIGNVKETENSLIIKDKDVENYLIFYK